MLDNFGFGVRQVSWLSLTLSDNVFLLLVSCNQSLGEMGLFLSKDSLLFGILSLILNNIELLECHSSLCLGDGDLLEKSESSLIHSLGLAIEFLGLFNSVSRFVGSSEFLLSELESLLASSESVFGSDAYNVRVGRSKLHVSNYSSFLGVGEDLASSLCKGIGFGGHGSSHD